MRPVTSEHLLLMAWLLWQRAVAQPTVCPRDEARCAVNADATTVFHMHCSGYGAVAQLPPACREPRVISTLVVSQGTTVDALQPRVLDGLRVRQLELVGLGIRSVSVAAFEAVAADLRVLHLQDNRIERLPLGVFRTILHLVRLQLHNNRLTQLGDGVFSGLVNVVYLTLNMNRISSVDADAWYAVPSLVTLMLQDNRLGDGGGGGGRRLLFPDGALGRLEELRLDANRLPAITADIVSGLPSLRRLYFRSNDVEALPVDVFRVSRRLEELDVSSNNITQLTANSFAGQLAL